MMPARKLSRFLFVILTAAVLSQASMAQDTMPLAPSTRASSSSSQTFRITPVRPIAELRAEALKAKPPLEQGKFESSRLVDLAKSGKGFRFEIRYATANNFLGEPVYEQARAFLQMPAADALARVVATLQKKGFGLLVYDAYRPWYVTKIFWEATPVDKREFVADPAQGSNHNRGCAVDLALYDLKTGVAVAMPSGYDEMTPRAYADYSGATAEEKNHRGILRKAMEKEGFQQRPNEWWHYDYKDWRKYAIVNLPFDGIRETKVVTPPRMLKSVEPIGGEKGR